MYEDIETGQQLGSVETNPLTGEYQIILVGGKRYAIIPTPLTNIASGTLLSINQLNIAASSSSNGGGAQSHRSDGSGGTGGSGSGTGTSKNGNSTSSGGTAQGATIGTSITTNSQSTSSGNGTNSTSSSNSTTKSNTTYMTKNTVIAESQYIDLVDLKEYIEIEQSLVVVPIETGQSISLNNLFFKLGASFSKKNHSWN